ncbi:MAG: hypothetical protein IJS36_08020 [Kiritimatiellae bacterium]|jgi:hypothetical protein|nr:hypothetical protein [Kiritimatiellia bacterium]
MKTDRHPFLEFLQTALKLLTDNWGLKLLALLLALIIYHSMKSEDSRLHAENDRSQYYYR